MANRSRENNLGFFSILKFTTAYVASMVAITWLTGSFAVPIIFTTAIAFATLFFLAITQDINRGHSRSHSRNSDVLVFDGLNRSYHNPTFSFSPHYTSPIPHSYSTSLNRDSGSYRQTSHYHASTSESHPHQTSHHHPSTFESRHRHIIHHHPNTSKSSHHHAHHHQSESSHHHAHHQHP